MKSDSGPDVCDRFPRLEISPGLNTPIHKLFAIYEAIVMT